ncbi:uncharacterized protein LOC102707560 [Oryza brachyantha]|uniref:uncharacterized protein LOC102707560 n=1 Tax=Oryza brachyantha TaxID=4533 RepID=UPI001ADC87EB|nr:uncharacterized protein LOC102707560 [Oryza brachyantha]
MDRKWMYHVHRSSTEYRVGVTEFVKFADNDRKSRMSLYISCPCNDCSNEKMIPDSSEVHSHLIRRGFMENYTCWSNHGEQEKPDVDADEEVSDQNTVNVTAAPESMFVPSALGGDTINFDTKCLSQMLHDIEDADDNDREFEKFSKLVEDCQMPLYDGCKSKHTKLSCVLELMKLKASNGWSDKNFTELLEPLKDMLSEGNKLPHTTYEAKQVLCPLGLEVRRIHACPNDCILYYKQYADLDVCPVCGACRYKCAKSAGERRPRQPGNDIDVFLEPMIDDFVTLWNESTRTWDAYAQDYFNLHPMVFNTINDYPALGNLSGQTVKRKWTCLECMEETRSKWLKNSHKMVYMGHKRFLPRYHPYRNMTKNFNSHRDTTRPPQQLTGTDVHNLLMGIANEFGKKRKVVKGKDKSMWKKKSIFWRLPYWKDLDVRHFIDPMHVEKNVCESLIGLLLNPSSTKDGLNARRDLQDMGVRSELHHVTIESDRVYLPPACYTLSKDEKMNLLTCPSGIKVPSGYSSRISRTSHPEGSIVESYTNEEVIDFCVDYLSETSSIGLPRSHHEGRLDGVGIVGRKIVRMDRKVYDKTHFTVLTHMTEVVSYVDEHLGFLRHDNPGRSDSWVRNKHMSSFNEWFKNRIAIEQNLSSETLKWLSQGPE